MLDDACLGEAFLNRWVWTTCTHKSEEKQLRRSLSVVSGWRSLACCCPFSGALARRPEDGTSFTAVPGQRSRRGRRRAQVARVIRQSARDAWEDHGAGHPDPISKQLAENGVIRHCRRGLIKSKSCLTHLISFCDKAPGSVDGGGGSRGCDMP